MSFLGSLFSAAAPLIAGAIPGIGPIASAALTAGAGAIGSSLTQNSAQQEARTGAEIRNAQQINQSERQMQFQTESNQKQMDFQERMSNTSHQREMADLKAAGLNPILAAKYGGASSPSGATSGGAQALIQDTVGPSMATGMAAKRLDTELQQARQTLSNSKTDQKLRKEQIDLTFQQESNARQEEQKIRNEIILSQVHAAKAAQETMTEAEHTRNAALNNELTRLQLPSRKTEAQIDESSYGKAIRYVMRLNPFGSTAVQLSRGK